MHCSGADVILTFQLRDESANVSPVYAAVCTSTILSSARLSLCFKHTCVMLLSQPARVSCFVCKVSMTYKVAALMQGNGMGYGWVSYGFGLAFFFPQLCFSYISAHVNPAFCLFLWVLGDLGPGDFFALAASEFAGMFVAACLVWVRTEPSKLSLKVNYHIKSQVSNSAKVKIHKQLPLSQSIACHALCV